MLCNEKINTHSHVLLLYKIYREILMTANVIARPLPAPPIQTDTPFLTTSRVQRCFFRWSRLAQAIGCRFVRDRTWHYRSYVVV